MNMTFKIDKFSRKVETRGVLPTDSKAMLMNRYGDADYQYDPGSLLLLRGSVRSYLQGAEVDGVFPQFFTWPTIPAGFSIMWTPGIPTEVSMRSMVLFYYYANGVCPKCKISYGLRYPNHAKFSDMTHWRCPACHQDHPVRACSVEKPANGFLDVKVAEYV